MSLAEPDTHDSTRRISEGLVPPDQLDAFTENELVETIKSTLAPAGLECSIASLSDGLWSVASR